MQPSGFPASSRSAADLQRQARALRRPAGGDAARPSGDRARRNRAEKEKYGKNRRLREFTKTGGGCDGDHSGKTGALLSFNCRGRERPQTGKQESIMGVLEIIIVGFIALNAALGASSLVTVRN